MINYNNYLLIKNTIMGAVCVENTCCADSNCGKNVIRKKAIKDMNKRGVYPPNQIEEKVSKNW